jgi:hypothetical protein
MTVLICHCCRTPDRIVFDHLIVALVHGSGYEGIATPGCSTAPCAAAERMGRRAGARSGE